MKSQTCSLGPLLLLMLSCFTGCASKQAYVIARRDPQYSPSSSHKIALAHQNQARPEEQELRAALVAEFERQGVQLVPQEAADYTLACWIENDWRTRKTIIQTVGPGIWLSGGVPTPMPPTPGSPAGWQPQLYYTTPFPAARVVDEQIPAQGVRLRLYPRHSSGSSRLQPAWEGYIDGGPNISSHEQPILLKTLLSYFGKEFTGRVRLLPADSP